MRQAWRLRGRGRSAFSAAFVASNADPKHSKREERHWAIGKTEIGRWLFLVFTLRERDGKQYIRPISARYMHRKEIKHYEEENPEL
jgi:uncharacterized DUF497 family protein